jgi:hypothetical protein
VRFRRVKGLFESFGYNEGVATILALLATEVPRVAATFDGKPVFIALGNGQLPQGASCSPAIVNILCRGLDRRLSGVARTSGFTYSRYCDDLVFSHPDRQAPVGALLGMVGQVIKDEGFAVNEAKRRSCGRRTGRSSRAWWSTGSRGSRGTTCAGSARSCIAASRLG